MIIIIYMSQKKSKGSKSIPIKALKRRSTQTMADYYLKNDGEAIFKKTLTGTSNNKE